MKILFDARPLAIPSPGGVTRITRSVLQALTSSLAHETCILGTTGCHDPLLDISNFSNAHHVHLNLPNKVVSGLTSLGICSFDRFFSTKKPDVLFLPNNGHVGFPKIPYGLLVHDLSFIVEPSWFSPRGQIWHKLVHAKRVMIEATRLFTVSEWTKFALMLHLGISADTIDVLPIPRKSEMALSAILPMELQNKRYLLCLGGNDRRKNATCVVEAVNLLHRNRTYKNLHLVIVDGYHEKLIDPRFIVLPRVDDSLLAALYQHAIAFLYPSWYEGLGLPLHEAMAFGTPSIASSTTAIPDTAPPGTLFAPPSKPHLWTHAIRLLIDQSHPRPSQSKQTTSSDETSWEHTIQPIKQFLLRYKK